MKLKASELEEQHLEVQFADSPSGPGVLEDMARMHSGVVAIALRIDITKGEQTTTYFFAGPDEEFDIDREPTS